MNNVAMPKLAPPQITIRAADVLIIAARTWADASGAQPGSRRARSGASRSNASSGETRSESRAAIVIKHKDDRERAAQPRLCQICGTAIMRMPHHGPKAWLRVKFCCRRNVW
jgi:hypothetical protein